MNSSVTWGLAVLELTDGDRWAAVILQPEGEELHGELSVRLKAAKLRPVSVREWNKGVWPVSRCSVTVAEGYVTQMHTGRSRLAPVTPAPVTPGWGEAAARGRVLLALVPPGAFDPGFSTGGPLGEGAWAGVDAAVQAGALLAGLAEVRATPEPYGMRW